MSDKPRPLSILIVEDDESTARALRVLFHQRAGAEVFSASSIDEARDILRDHTPTCVLLDLMLPGGDGEELLEQLRDEGYPSRVVVVTSCVVGGERYRKAQSLGPAAIISKPYEIDQLIAALVASPTHPTPGATALGHE